MAVSGRFLGVLGILGTILASGVYLLAAPGRESREIPAGDPWHYEGKEGIQERVDLPVSERAPDNSFAGSSQSVPHQSGTVISESEVADQSEESNVRTPSSDLNEEIQMLEQMYNDRVTEICTELTAHGLYDVLSRDAANEEVELAINSEILQSFRTVIVGDFQEMRQFDFTKEEFPDLYLMRQHIEILSDLSIRALTQEGKDSTSDR